MNLVETLKAEKESLLEKKRSLEVIKATASRKLDEAVEEIHAAFNAVGLKLVNVDGPGDEKDFTIQVVKGEYVEKVRVSFAPECWTASVDMYGDLDENLEKFKKSIADKVTHVMSYTF